MDKRQIKGPDGKLLDGTVVTVKQASEQWNSYLLDDGTLLKIKVIVTDVFRIDGQHDADGNPVYLTRSANVLSVQAPEELRKQL